MTKQIPESEIALNPVVIDDSKRGLPPKEKYIRVPFNCEMCRIEHNIQPYHYGPDPDADCGKCIATSILKGAFE